MKKKQLLFVAGVLIVMGVFTVSFLSSDKECQYTPRKTSEQVEDGLYYGAAQYWHSRQADINGKIDVEAMHEVQSRVETSAKAKSVGAEINWMELGPDNFGGRTRAILIDKTNPNIMYAGAVSGGLWKSTTAGLSWNKVNYTGDANSDEFTNLFVTCITQAANGDIYFGTGELEGSMRSNFYNYQANDQAGGGNGIWKSTDGNSFTRVESTWSTSDQKTTFRFVNRLAADPSDANLIYAATWKGLRYTEDGGATWNSVPAMGTAELQNCYDVKVGSDGTVICDAKQRFYVAPQGVLSNFSHPIGSIEVAGGRLELAIAPSDPNYMYIQAAFQNGTFAGMFKSTDMGQTWDTVGYPYLSDLQITGRQGIYDNVLAVDPANKERVICGGQRSVYEWTGAQWNMIASGGFDLYDFRYVHADHHAIVFHPEYGVNGNQTLFMGTDGGIHVSYDGGYSFSALNKNYSTIQFFKVDCDGYGHVIGGTQDNGTFYNDYSGNTVRNHQKVRSGDGATSILSELNPDVAFSSYVYGDISRTDEKNTENFNFDYVGKHLFNFQILNKYYGGNASNIGSPYDANYRSAAFVTLFDLWESFYDPKSIDTVLAVNYPQQYTIEEFPAYIALLEQTFTNFSYDTSHYTTNDGEIMVVVELTIGAGEKVVVNSSIYDRPLYYTLQEDMGPLDTIRVQDTYQAMMAVPLYDYPDDEYTIWITRKPVNMDVLAIDQPWANILKVPFNIDTNPNDGYEARDNGAIRALKFSADGDHLFFAYYNTLYRVSNLSNCRTPESMSGSDTINYNLDVQSIQTFPQRINSIAVDPNDPDRVIVTIAGFGTGDHIYLSQNATTLATFTGKDGAGTTRYPDMPAYSSLITVYDGNIVFIGSHYGVYMTEDISAPDPDWVNQDVNGFPHVMVADLAQQIHVNKWLSGVTNGGHIYVGTHGRGIFRTTDYALSIDDPVVDEKLRFSADKLHIYPNPATDNVKVDVELLRSGNIQLEVFDISGRLVKIEEFNSLPVGQNTLDLEVGDLNQGTYILSIFNGKIRQSGRLIVQ